MIVAILSVAALIVVLVREAIAASERRVWLRALMQRRLSRDASATPLIRPPDSTRDVDELGDTSRYGPNFFRRKD